MPFSKRPLASLLSSKPQSSPLNKMLLDWLLKKPQESRPHRKLPLSLLSKNLKDFSQQLRLRESRMKLKLLVLPKFRLPRLPLKLLPAGFNRSSTLLKSHVSLKPLVSSNSSRPKRPSSRLSQSDLPRSRL